jgi:hypothetical protein
VSVFAVPAGGGDGYERFTLEPDGLPYDETMAPMGCVPADFDEDGALDFLVYYWGRSPVLFLNQAPPGVVPRAENFMAHELIRPMEVWNTTALAVADEALGRPVLAARLLEHTPGGVLVVDKPWLATIIERSALHLELTLYDIATILPPVRQT